jgi:hypothetical protein
MDDKIDIWRKLSDDLLKHAVINPNEVKGGYLDCGKLTIPINGKFNKHEFIASPTTNISEDIRNNLGEFLISFMNANG